MNKFVYMASVLFFLSCANNAAKHEGHDTAAPMISDTAAADHTMAEVKPMVTADHYYGLLPCADCSGIQTEITLTSDNKYVIHAIYEGRKSAGPGSNEFSEEGTWMQHGTDTVHLQGRKSGPAMYIKTDSSIIQLDMKGQRITGQLAEKYELKKTGK